MKKIKMSIFILILLVSFSVCATSGTIKQDSIIECNGKYYGNHGNPVHWHIVEKKDNKWVSISSEVDIPSCYIKEVNVKEKVLFSQCVDGDTARFIINGEEKKVRFLAIDTPEVASGEKTGDPFGKEASEYTCNSLKKAKELYLEYDSNSDKEDKYGRVLAFVYTDDILLEKSLIENGLAKVYYIYGDYEHLDILRKAEEKAKENKLGIWSIDNQDEIKLEDVKDDDTSEEVSIIQIIIEILKNIIAFFLK